MTYNLRHFASGDLRQHGWGVMTPAEFASRYLEPRGGELVMATLSLRIRDDSKKRQQSSPKRQGVSLNNFINATLAATVAQAETLAFSRIG